MANEQLGGGSIKLAVDGKEMGKGLKKAETDLQGFMKSIQGSIFSGSSIGAGLGVGLVGAFSKGIGAVLDLIENRIQNVQKTGKAALNLGFSPESLSKVNYAFTGSVESNDSLINFLENVNEKIGEAEMGSSAAIDTFRQLGVSWEVLAKSPLDRRVVLLADAFAKLNNPDLGQSLLKKLGGKSAPEWLGVMSKGGAYLEGRMEQAGGVGAVVSAQDVKSEKGRARQQSHLGNRYTETYGGIGDFFGDVWWGIKSAPLLPFAGINKYKTGQSMTDYLNPPPPPKSGISEPNSKDDLLARNIAINNFDELQERQRKYRANEEAEAVLAVRKRAEPFRDTDPMGRLGKQFKEIQFLKNEGALKGNDYLFALGGVKEGLQQYVNTKGKIDQFGAANTYGSVGAYRSMIYNEYGGSTKEKSFDELLKVAKESMVQELAELRKIAENTKAKGSF